MSAYDFSIQAGQICELEERVEKLEEQNKILHDWIQYFKDQLKEPE